MRPRPKTTMQVLGRSLIKSKKRRPTADQLSERHTVHDDPSNAKSITENTSLDDFLSTAEMSNKQFVAERQNIKIIESAAVSQPSTLAVVDESLEQELLIPRRPSWDRNTTPEELHQAENESYLKWRRRLAQLQERDDLVLTPFEKNLDFWRQLWRVVERSDVLVQILDARNPLLFFCEDLDVYIKEVGGERKLPVILLNKSDYLTERQRRHWFDYFTSIGKVVVFFSALEQQPTTVAEEEVEEKEAESSEEEEEDEEEVVETKLESLNLQKETEGEDSEARKRLYTPLSYSELIAYFKSLRSRLPEDVALEGPLTVGLIGYPNVGKSSTINALLRSKAVSVSAMPGKTKHFQTILLDDQLTICDCPGLVFPNVVSSKSEMIINGILPIDQMKEAVPPIAAIAARIPGHVFETRYGLMLPRRSEDNFGTQDEEDEENRKATALELLSAYGYAKGFMTARGLPDTSRAARYLLKDFVCGRLLFCYAPPTVPQQAFHRYPRSSKALAKEASATANAITDRRLLKAYEGQALLKKRNFNEEYFAGLGSAAHTKGSRGIAVHSREFIQQGGEAFGAAAAVEGKPWKRHHNRKKKEKLRKVYAHLDE